MSKPEPDGLRDRGTPASNDHSEYGPIDRQEVPAGSGLVRVG